jgi:hypothetical protein
MLPVMQTEIFACGVALDAEHSAVQSNYRRKPVFIRAKRRGRHEYVAHPDAELGLTRHFGAFVADLAACESQNKRVSLGVTPKHFQPAEGHEGEYPS